MKKIYSQPQTQKLKLQAGIQMQTVGEGSDAQTGWTGDAPLRQFTGDAVQGLKYLI